ncbi:hypothetical protein NHX12_003341 [Muraenolepis orangiensis]|uniref:Beta-1,4-N-acetylgalactosaminyltransferase n=1 Tax=Muraenolepis orangiensis TaxID=630683 RepID=A0A9Q0E077_9TELE|nr:hypothetical protein NHX12_003341 [Muraenolepis orangiensis]
MTMSSVLPLKKLRRKGRFLIGLILVLGVLAVVHELLAGNTWSSHNQAPPGQFSRRTQLTAPQKAHWKPDKGQANMHVFEDWCGSSIDQLRKNLHYPLYPHIRTTVPKLAVSPQWTNYGLRIFGYLHPYADGEFVFAVGSQDNSEFWLSTSESPLDGQLLAWVGKTGSEWTAPGEYGKFASQTSRPVRLSVQRKYFFELIHKQGDKATDHVELAWKTNQDGLKFKVIGSKHISIYTNESLLLMSDVAHIPQTDPSHSSKPKNQSLPLISGRSLSGVLPDCSYKPSYIIRGFNLIRYQGLQFVHMTYIYPQDYTRLTHMETENGCFYHESDDSLKHSGFSRYMRLDYPEGQESEYRLGDIRQQRRDAGNGRLADYRDDYDGGARKRARKLLSVGQERRPGGPDVRNASEAAGRRLHEPMGAPLQRALPVRPGRRKVKLQIAEGREEVGPRRQTVNAALAHKRKKHRKEKLQPAGTMQPPAESTSAGRIQRPPVDPDVYKRGRRRIVKRSTVEKLQVAKGVPQQSRENGFVPQQGVVSTFYPDLPAFHPIKPPKDPHLDLPAPEIKHNRRVEANRRAVWDKEMELDVFDPEVVWSQTFQVNQLDLQLLRSDWIDLNCNVSGNMMLRPSDAQGIVKGFMDKLDIRHPGRYLLELEIRDQEGQEHSLSKYVYTLERRNRLRSKRFPVERAAPEFILCNPFGFQWNPTATVHFIVPVKNQARWVIQLICDMEELYRVTGDVHFSLIVVDYESTDMDVLKALQTASLPQYEYLKLTGNFQRSAGLQAGIDLITDDHSIVFLCDLHIYFPMSILASLRKHCVEGHMAFAPILMRLNCYWEVNGFGLMGVYKSDLVAAGGMNTREFTDRWGGEDWELLDRILQSGLEVERIHLRNFFHYYHSKRGMWNRRTAPIPRW